MKFLIAYNNRTVWITEDHGRDAYVKAALHFANEDGRSKDAMDYIQYLSIVKKECAYDKEHSWTIADECMDCHYEVKTRDRDHI